MKRVWIQDFIARNMDLLNDTSCSVYIGTKRLKLNVVLVEDRGTGGIVVNYKEPNTGFVTKEWPLRRSTHRYVVGVRVVRDSPIGETSVFILTTTMDEQ